MKINPFAGKIAVDEHASAKKQESKFAEDYRFNSIVTLVCGFAAYLYLNW